MKKTGIIVARFQTPYLHEGHIRLIWHVGQLCDRLIFFLGVSPTRLTINNPLSYEARHIMLKQQYPMAEIYPLPDQQSDVFWSEQLDKLVDEKCKGENVTLYGCRGSFIARYHGKYKTEYTPIEVEGLSATNIRKELHKQTGETADWRKGIIFASGHKFPTSYQTVDAAIMDFNHYRLLLGRKAGETKFRFVGGFVDPSDESLEMAAKREVIEECGAIETDNYRYVGSFRMKSWRFTNETDKIMTALFCCNYIFGHPEPKDDIEQLEWFDLAVLTNDDIVEEHHELFEAFKKFLNTHKK